MSLHKTIAEFLRSRVTWPYCDDCILEEIDEATLAEVREETKAMRGQIDFMPGGFCTRCNGHKQTTMAMIAPSRPPA